MKLTKLAKDAASRPGGCPTVYEGEDGSFVVQGQGVDAATFAELEHVLPGEAAVHIAPEVVRAALRRHQDGR